MLQIFLFIERPGEDEEREESELETVFTSLDTLFSFTHFSTRPAMARRCRRHRRRRHRRRSTS